MQVVGYTIAELASSLDDASLSRIGQPITEGALVRHTQKVLACVTTVVLKLRAITSFGFILHDCEIRPKRTCQFDRLVQSGLPKEETEQMGASCGSDDCGVSFVIFR